MRGEKRKIYDFYAKWNISNTEYTYKIKSYTCETIFTFLFKG